MTHCHTHHTHDTNPQVLWHQPAFRRRLMNRNRSTTREDDGLSGEGEGEGGADSVGGLEQWLDRRGLVHTMGVLSGECVRK